jgi:predicted secreted acid phosphatase
MASEQVLDWLKYVSREYERIATAELDGRVLASHELAGLSPNQQKNVMLDLDETLVYHTTNHIPGAKEFVSRICDAGLSVHIVTGRIDSAKRREETAADLEGFPRHKLHMRPSGEPHADYKARIKKMLSPVFSVADQEVDCPEYLIKNPFYVINAEGEEIYL